jgi:hypothetical protein
MLQSLVNHWISLFSAWHTNQKVKILTCDIARQCRATLIQLVISKTKKKAMPPEQMRGYVRAYANSQLETVIKQRNDLKHFNPSQISKVILEAKELLIDIVVCEVMSIPPTVVVKMANAA